MDFSEGDMHAEQEGNSNMVFNLPVSGQYKKKPLMLANVVGDKRQKHLGSLSIRGKVFNKFRTSHYVPELSNKTNLINLAKIAYNAYSTPIKEDWYNLTSDYDLERSFGWENDGVRGHVFSSHDNSTIILGFKGTSAAIVSGDSPTSGNDKLNDNRMFSCCCARVDPTWYTVCDCYKGNSTCGNMCVEKAMDGKDMYFDTAQAILFAVLDQYPMVRNIWLTGHSLGGGLAAMLGLAFDIPTVTFQSPGDLLAAQRLHLPLPEEDKLKDLPIWHFGHTADPIYMGKCNGVLSSCYIAGYALETGCHTGNACIYDTVKDFKWSPDIRRHRLGVVIDEVLSVYNDTAKCMPQTNCTDCSAWNYLEN